MYYSVQIPFSHWNKVNIAGECESVQAIVQWCFKHGYRINYGIHWAVELMFTEQLKTQFHMTFDEADIREFTRYLALTFTLKQKPFEKLEQYQLEMFHALPEMVR